MIKKTITLVALFFVVLTNAQINAITETGDKVILFKDKTWKYSNDSLNVAIEISKNDKLFLKNKESTFLVKSSKSNIGIWINPKNWTFSKAKPDSPSEFKFNNKNLDVYGMLIAEKIQIPIETLINIAYQNAMEAASDIKIIEKEYRNVNGLDVVMMKMKGTIQGVKFTYYGYYYSNSEGSFQFLTYTSTNMFKDYENEMSDLLNGLVEY